jgi:pyruvate/2-oxoglutarate dehydrogenase complex dihydrolipoamide acyltransferase (E2) component
MESKKSNKKRTYFNKLTLKKLDKLDKENKETFKEDKATLKILTKAINVQKRIIKKRLLLKCKI